MNDTTDFMFSLFRGPLDAFVSRGTTELECVRVWLSMTSGVTLKKKVKSNLITKLAERLSDHWKSLGDTMDFADKKVAKAIRTKVKSIVDRAETLRRNSTKHFGDRNWMDRTRRLFLSVIVIESPSKNNSSVPAIEVKIHNLSEVKVLTACKRHPSNRFLKVQVLCNLNVV